MKKLLLLIVISLIACSKEEIHSSQKVTYRLNVIDVGYKIWYTVEDFPAKSVNQAGISDTTVIRHVGDTLSFHLRATCAEDQRQSFVMQILLNDVEVKSKSYTIKNICNSFDYDMRYVITCN